MALRKSIFLAAVTAASLFSSHAFAVRINERPPPTGMNGPSVQGLDQGLAAKGQQDGFPVHASKLTSVTFPDGSRANVQ
jgi:hypothetical protein